MKILYLSLLTVFLQSLLPQLKQQQANADKQLKSGKNLIVLAKLPGKKSLVKIINDKWPDDVEYSYNILKDKSGKVIMVAQMPFSQSGDWMLSYRHYFNEKGDVYCFKKDESLFDDSVKDGIVLEIIEKYYGDNFKLISQNSHLEGMKGKILKRNRNDFGFRDDKYTIYKNVSECLKGYNITL